MLKPEDTFRVECVNSISEDSIVSLVNLYQPLIGGDGVLLYLTLHAEARHQRSQSTHRHLCRVMDNIPIDTLERCRFRLEEYNLLRCYKKETANHDSWIYHLNTPLPTVDFLNNGIYRTRMNDALGRKDSEEIFMRLGNVGINLDGFQDVTRPFKASHAEISQTPSSVETKWQTVKPRYTFDADSTEISFDYGRFLTTTSNIVFPVSLRDEENMALIGRLATVYDISADRMREIVGRCTTPEPAALHVDKLKLLCARERVQVKQVKDKYQLPPVSFLQSLNNGAEVILSEKKILENLAVNWHFSNEVINIMIEYILEKSDNKLNKNFVDKVATTWARDGVTNREQALYEVKKDTNGSYAKTGYKKPLQVVPLPDYMNQPQPEETPLSQEQKERIRNLQAKLKGGRK